jgi:hypothetical protein
MWLGPFNLGLGVLLDDEVAVFMLFDHGLDVRQLVTWHDGETARVVPQPLVLVNPHVEHLVTVLVRAFADEVESSRPSVGQLRDPLVDPAKEDLVLSQPFLTR